MRKSLTNLILLVSIVTGFLLSCSAPSTKTQTISAKRLTCSETECDKATLSLLIPSGYMQGSDRAYFVGQQNQPSTWTVYAGVELSDGSSAKDRDVRLYAVNKQDGPHLSGNESDTLTLSWTPLNAIEEGDSDIITIYARDVDRCKFENKGDTDKCTDMKKRLKEYDETTKLGFYITKDEDLEAVADRLNYIGSRDVADVSGTILKGCLIGALPGVIGAFTGGGGTAILSAMKGCNTGATAANTAFQK